MSVGTGTLTVEEFLKIPDPKEGHNELHHGEIVVRQPPKRGHQRLQSRLEDLLRRIVVEEYVVETEMAFRPAPEHEVWQADVGCISRDRDEATGYDEYLVGAPDVVIEVLSPGNTVDEMNDKMAILFGEWVPKLLDGEWKAEADLGYRRRCDPTLRLRGLHLVLAASCAALGSRDF